MIQLSLKILVNKLVIRTKFFKRKRLNSVELLVLDFDGVMTDNKVIVSQDGAESVSCWRSDGVGLEKLKLLGVRIIVLSTEKNPVVNARANKLGLECRQGIIDKGIEILNICDYYKINLLNVVFLGNDINDLSGFKVVGYPMCVADSHPDIYPYVIYMSKNKGGSGAVREISDLIYEAKQLQ